MAPKAARAARSQSAGSRDVPESRSQRNLSGGLPLHGGCGRRVEGSKGKGPAPMLFERGDEEGIVSFFEREGWVAIAGCLSPAELAELNEFCDATQISAREQWGIDGPHPLDQ